MTKQGEQEQQRKSSESKADRPSLQRDEIEDSALDKVSGGFNPQPDPPGQHRAP